MKKLITPVNNFIRTKDKMFQVKNEHEQVEQQTCRKETKKPSRAKRLKA